MQRYLNEMLTSNLFDTAPVPPPRSRSRPRPRVDALNSEGVEACTRGDLISAPRRNRGEGLRIASEGRNSDGLWRTIPSTDATLRGHHARRRVLHRARCAWMDGEPVRSATEAPPSPKRAEPKPEVDLRKSLAGPGSATMLNRRHAMRAPALSALPEEKAAEFAHSKARFLGQQAPSAQRRVRAPPSLPESSAAGRRVRTAPELLLCVPRSVAPRSQPRKLWATPYVPAAPVSSSKLSHVPSGISTLTTLTPSGSLMGLDSECSSGALTPAMPIGMMHKSYSTSSLKPRPWV